MSHHKDLLHIWQSRGFVHQSTPLDALDLALGKELTMYHGCDATADSLHVGHLCGLIALRWAQEVGHRTILLMGGGTTKIGDPSGRSSVRPMLTATEIDTNIAGILSSCMRILKTNETIVVNNDEWLSTLEYVPFLRDIGKHFSVNRMLQCESVRLRLDREDHLSFIEFNYMLLQAYDYLQLYRTHQCTLQVGGGDQWGNLVSGVDLIRRVEGHAVHALTWPLLETSRGEKMGKSAAGAVWLDPAKLSAWDFWQFWRNVDDRDVVRFLSLFTMLPLTDIQSWQSIQGQELNEGKILLANTVTALVHGQETVDRLTATRLLPEGSAAAGNECDQYRLSAQDIQDGGVVIYKVLVALGWVQSGREGKQKIEQGAVRLQGEKITDPLTRLDTDSITQPIRIHYGSKRMGTIHL